jgi:hypothetical protein
MPVEVIVVMVTIAKVPIVVIPRKLSVVKVASGVGIAAGNVAAGDSSTSVVGAPSIHNVVTAIATSVCHAAAISTAVYMGAIAAAIISHVAAIPTATILATATATATIAATTAVSDKRDCAAVSYCGLQIGCIGRIGGLPNERGH